MSTLLRENKNGWESISDIENKAIFKFCEKYKNFIDEAKTERLAVQGVMDLIVIDEQGKLLLVDYKTDRLTKEELMDENAAAKRLNQVHGLQLSYYAHAAAMLFDRPCDRLAIYSTHGARLFDVTPLPLILSKNISRLL